MNKLKSLISFFSRFARNTKAMADYMRLAKDWGIPIIIIVASFAILPNWLTTLMGPTLGPVLGQATGYAISAVVAAIALWLSKQAQKRV